MQLKPNQALAIAKSFSAFKNKPGFVSASFNVNRQPHLGNVPLLPQIDPFIEYVFSFGQCHSLAYALHEILGWPVFGAYHQYGGDRTTCHYFVRSPCSGMGDVYGLSCIDYGYRKTDPEHLLRKRKFPAPCLELARHYAPMVVERINTGRRYR